MHRSEQSYEVRAYLQDLWKKLSGGEEGHPEMSVSIALHFNFENGSIYYRRFGT